MSPDEFETEVFIRPPGADQAVDVTAFIPAQAARTELLPLLREAAIDPPPERSTWELHGPDGRLLPPEERWWPFVERGRAASTPGQSGAGAGRPPRRGAGTLYGRRRRWLPRGRAGLAEVRSVVTTMKIAALWLTIFAVAMTAVKIFMP